MPYDKNSPYNDLPNLPPAAIETVELLKLAIRASRDLAELKGLCETMPDPALLLNTIVLQESRDSSAIENIVTTQDELYQAEAEEDPENNAAKEVLRYRQAIYAGLQHMQHQQQVISTNTIIEVVQTIKNNTAGIRNQPGTQLKSNITGEVIYTPPCCEEEIRQKLAALENYINDQNSDAANDPLVKLALIHYQFEAIHPFADGNGRAGRILNSLYLVQQNLLPRPILYLSSYIMEHKQDYYQLLSRVTEQQQWANWIMFMLTAVSQTARLTIKKIKAIQQQKLLTENRMKETLRSSYKPGLLQLLYTSPYVKIEMLVNNGLAHRQTASGYMKKLTAAGIVQPLKKGRNTYYINTALMNILSQRN